MCTVSYCTYVGYHNMIILVISSHIVVYKDRLETRCFIFPVFLTHSNGKPYLFKADHCRSGGDIANRTIPQPIPPLSMHSERGALSSIEFFHL